MVGVLALLAGSEAEGGDGDGGGGGDGVGGVGEGDGEGGGGGEVAGGGEGGDEERGGEVGEGGGEGVVEDEAGAGGGGAAGGVEVGGREGDGEGEVLADYGERRGDSECNRGIRQKDNILIVRHRHIQPPNRIHNRRCPRLHPFASAPSTRHLQRPTPCVPIVSPDPHFELNTVVRGKPTGEPQSQSEYPCCRVVIAGEGGEAGDWGTLGGRNEGCERRRDEDGEGVVGAVGEGEEDGEFVGGVGVDCGVGGGDGRGERGEGCHFDGERVGEVFDDGVVVGEGDSGDG